MISMTESVFLDSTSVRRTSDGFLVAQPRVARTGIQVYSGREVGRPDLERVRVYRPDDEVFSSDTMKSTAHRPVTIDHPPQMVDAKNWKKYARGQTGDEVVRDGQFIRVPMILMDEEAIKDWDRGRKEISMGYTCDFKWESGETDDGEAYDAMQRDIRMNHLAIVGKARGGADLRLGDDEEFDDQDMVECPECGSEVSADEPVCPECGHDMSSTENDPIWDGVEFLDKGNPNHYPAGTGKGGQFAPSGNSGGSGSRRVGKKENLLNRAAELTKSGYYIGHQFVKGGGKGYQVTHPDQSKTGVVFKNKESAVEHAESHARAHGTIAQPHPNAQLVTSEEGPNAQNPTKHIGGALRELQSEFGHLFPGHKGGEVAGTPLEFGHKKSVFASKALAREHIRKQIRLWKQAKAVKGPRIYVPRRGLLGLLGMQKGLSSGYRIHYPKVRDSWEIFLDESLMLLPLTDVDLVEVEDYNPNHDPESGEFTSGGGFSAANVGLLAHISKREAATSTFSEYEKARKHAQVQLETWKKHAASQEEALHEIKKQIAKWQKAKIYPHYKEVRHGVIGLGRKYEKHFTVGIDSVPEVELTDTDLIEARICDEQMQIESRFFMDSLDANPNHDPHTGEFSHAQGGEEHGPEVFPLHLENVLSEYAQGKYTAKEVQTKLAAHGWRANLRGTSSQIEVWAPEGTGRTQLIQI